MTGLDHRNVLEYLLLLDSLAQRVYIVVQVFGDPTEAHWTCLEEEARWTFFEIDRFVIVLGSL